ncbi:MAG TPA: HD domain-containing phosphohydrolase [Edaphobacter sp.]|nr:HD domain-containing phosphohydrolase [Edaphobacter sp.]
MNRAAFAYVYALLAVMLVLLASLPIAPLLHIGGADAAGVLTFVALGLLSEVLALDIAAQKQVASSILFIPLLACITLFPPAIGSWAAVLAVSLSGVVRRRAWWVTAFNTAEVTIACTAGALAYVGSAAIGREVGDTRFLPFVALAIVFFTTNALLVAGLVAIRQGTAFLQVLRQIVGPAGANLVYDILASPIAMGVAYLYRTYHIPGLLFTVLPLLLLRQAYLSKLELVRVNKDLLRVLIKAIETRDPYTSGHSLRVSTLARAIAEDMGLSGKQVERVETAALLHDIGKIDALYAELIMKPHDLTPDERDVIKTHATKGADLLRSLSAFDEDIIKSVRHHHERYDGKGYPDGLAGESIPLPSRIIMLCDSVDAMLSDRPYRPARTLEFTEQEVKRCAGSQFDPVIVDVMLARGTLHRATRLLKAEAEELVLATI